MIWLVLLLQIPAAATSHRAAMTRSAYRIHGPAAPAATLAAQIHQESAWKPEAVSWVGAQGLAQFMPATAADMARQYPAECAPANPFSPRWAFGCRDRYLASLLRASLRPVGAGTVGACSGWSFALRAYNGGLGWINRDRRLAVSRALDGNDWRAMRDVNAGRRESAHRENREYPERIHRLAGRYARAGWGATICEVA
jgi:soluble lytic murein transglycosylase-like protein